MNIANLLQAGLGLVIAGCILLQSALACSANTCVGAPNRATVKAICGRLFNQTGEVPDQAELVLTNESNAAQYVAKIDKKGAFSFAPVLPGDYTLRATAPGYLPEQRKLRVIRNQSSQACKTIIQVKLGLVACSGSTFIKGFDKEK